MTKRLPTGGTIPQEAWRRRHLGITLIIWAHAVAIPVYALLRGYSIVHSLLESAIVPIAAIVAGQRSLAERARMAAASVGLMACSSLLIHLSGGLIEMHFHFFVMIIVISLYQDWRSFLIAIGFVLVHHGVVGVMSPESVYNHPAAIDHPWLFAGIHSGFVTAASVASLVNWRLNENHLRAAARAEQRLTTEIRLIEKLNQAETALTADLDVDDVAKDIVDLAVDLMSADYGAFVYRSVGASAETHLRCQSSDGSAAPEISIDCPDAIRLAPTLISGDIMRTEDLLGSAAAPDLLDLLPAHAGTGGPAKAALSVPVRVRGAAYGALVLFGHDPGGFDAAGERAATGLAAHAGVVIENAQLYMNQHTAAATLQKSLLPAELPAVPGLQVAAHYSPADTEFDIGGDWYDAFPLPGGALGVVMGDVVGRGLPAASLMGQLRNTLRAYALEGHSPGAALGRLNAMACALDLGFVATTVFVVLDPASGSACVASAGHPPILLTGPGAARYLDVHSGAALGWLECAEYPETIVPVRPGWSLVLYTDGLVEDRETKLDDGLERLRHAADGLPADLDADAICAHLLRHGAGKSESADDTAIMVVRCEPAAVRPSRRPDPERDGSKATVRAPTGH